MSAAALSLPFNQTSKRLKGNQSQLSFKARENIFLLTLVPQKQMSIPVLYFRDQSKGTIVWNTRETLYINTMWCPIKNTNELTVHTSCHWVLDLLCISKFSGLQYFVHLNNLFDSAFTVAVRTKLFLM